MKQNNTRYMLFLAIYVFANTLCFSSLSAQEQVEGKITEQGKKEVAQFVWNNILGIAGDLTPEATEHVMLALQRRKQAEIDDYVRIVRSKYLNPAEKVKKRFLSKLTSLLDHKPLTSFFFAIT